MGLVTGNIMDIIAKYNIITFNNNPIQLTAKFMSTLKPQQAPQFPKHLQILQSCTQIPKDDRLLLRKILKQGCEQLTTILADFGNKKLQVRLRKFMQKWKEGKKGDVEGQDGRDRDGKDRMKTVGEAGKGLGKDEVQSYYKSALQSLEKSKGARKSMQASKVQDFHIMMTICDENRYARSNSHSQLLKPSQTLTNKLISPKQSLLTEQTLNSKSPWNYSSPVHTPHSHHSHPHPHPPLPISTSTKYTLQQPYLKQSSNLYTSPDFLKYDSLRTVNSMPTSNLGSVRNSVVLTSYPISGYMENGSGYAKFTLPEQFSLPSFQKQPNNILEQKIHTFKTLLLKYYAQDIFDFITTKYFPLTLHERSVYLPYRQMLTQIQTYLNNKAQKIQLITQTTQKIPILDPFTTQYQNITLKSLGNFLSRYCLHKPNPIKNIFIVHSPLQPHPHPHPSSTHPQNEPQPNKITIQKFNKINMWKGGDLCNMFEKLVKRWGDGTGICYWEVWRVRGDKEWGEFFGGYGGI